MGYGLLGLVIFILDIMAIIEIVKSGLETSAKILWVLLVLLLPLVGMLLWFIIGSKRLA